MSGEVDLTPDLLIGRAVWLEVIVESYPDDKGNEKKRNQVTFAGYERAEGVEVDAAAEGSKDGDDTSEENCPF